MSSSGATTVRTGHGRGAAVVQEGVLAPGTNIGRYVTLGSVGRGATGVVYRAYDPELDRRIAVKLFAARPEQDDRAAVLREARALAKLRHPNVVTVFDVGAHDGRVFVAMELVEGANLRAWLGQTARTPAEIRRAIAEAGRGLAAAHAAGVIHCDFKPSNVLVAEDGAVYVADFGLARAGAKRQGPEPGAGLLESDEDHLTTMPPGTPAYLAPELYAGGVADVRSDVYAFCLTAWEALVGRRPWEHEDEIELLARKKDGPPTEAGVPRIVVEGLSPDPSRRPQSVDAIVSALDPRSGRRWWPLALGAVGVAAVAGYALTAPAPCDGAPDRTADLSPPDLPDAPAKLAANLGRFAARWQAEHLDACEATHVRHEQSERLLDLRMQCLDRKLDQVHTLVELVRGSSEAAMESPRAVAKLTAALDCSAAAVDGETPPPASAELDRVEVLEAVAQYADALRLAETLEDEEGPLGIWARYRIGRLEDRTGNPKTALDALQKVHWEAEAAGVDDVAAKAGIYVLYEQAAVLHDTEAALAWAPHVEAAIERAGNDELDRAAFVENVGIAHLYDEQAEEAEASFEESLRLREGAAAHDPLAIVSSLGNLGILYEETHRYREAIAQQERALQILEEVVGDAHPHTARVIDNLGTAHLRNGDLATAVEYFRRAFEIRRTVHGPNHRTVGVSLVHLALAALQQGNPDTSIEHYGAALEIYERVYDSDGLDVLQCHEGLAHAYAMKEDWPAAHEHAKTALAGLRNALRRDHPELKALEKILASP